MDVIEIFGATNETNITQIGTGTAIGTASHTYTNFFCPNPSAWRLVSNIFLRYLVAHVRPRPGPDHRWVAQDRPSQSDMLPRRWHGRDAIVAERMLYLGTLRLANICQENILLPGQANAGVELFDNGMQAWRIRIVAVSFTRPFSTCRPTNHCPLPC